MRVIAGTARSLPLKTPAGMNTRPTTDRIKETLFNILAPYLPGAVFADAFAGSGGIGIEALSRGAKKAYFIENDPKALQCIRENLAFTRMADKAVVLRQDVISALPMLTESRLDLVFADPPYQGGFELPFLKACRQAKCVDDQTLIVLEALLEQDFSFASDLGFTVVREKNYKTNKHVFLKKNLLDNDTVLRHHIHREG